MDINWLDVGLQLVKFALDNVIGIISFVGVVKVALDQNDKKKAEEAKQKAFMMAIDATRMVAQETIGNKEKRAKAAQFVLEAMPANVKKYVSPFTVELLIEKAYAQVTKPNM